MKEVTEQVKNQARRFMRHRHVQRTTKLFHMSMAIIAALALLSVIAQFLYPADRALPLSNIDKLAVGGKSQTEIEQALEKFAADAALVVSTPTKQYHPKWASIGVTLDRSTTARAAVEYAWWERLVPFSSLARLARAANTTPIVIVDKERLHTFAQRVVDENRQAANEPALVINQGEVVIQSGKAGFVFTIEDVERQLKTMPFGADERVALRPRFVPIRLSQDELVYAKLRAEQILKRELTLTIGEKTFKPDRPTRGSWLAAIEDTTTHHLMIRLKREALASYIATVSAQIATPPGVTKVTLLDGQEVAQIEGAVGRAVNVDTALAAVEKALFDPATPTALTLALETQPPKVEYTRTYSQGDAGLNALIRDWEAETYGTYGIIVREINGQQRYAEFQPDRLFVTSSTYKMFVAYGIFKKMEAGEITDDTVLDNGWTVRACMNEMILHSTNPCAIAFQNWLGWQASEDMIHQAGFSNTFINNEDAGDKQSTVRDETNFMLRLQAGTLLNSIHTERLLNLFKQQVWRGGIPSGVPRGTVVANKVGFYNGYVHDVGIVYGPRSTYILGIMSRGGSDPGFANLSRRVYNFFNR